MIEIPSSRHSLRFSLAISADLYLRYYQGGAQAVLAKTHDGRYLEIPASVLQRFVTHDGVYGTFEIEFDANHKFLSIRRIAD